MEGDLLESTKPLRILVVEDSLSVSTMMKDLLEEEFYAEVEIAEDCASARKKFSSKDYDIVALDYRLPDGHGHELLSEITVKKDHPLVIMVTAYGDEEIAALSLRLGASGYVIKDRRLSSMLTDAVNKALDEIALKEAQEELWEYEQRYRLLIDNSLSGILVHDGFNVLYVNESISRISGYPKEHFANMKNVLDMLVPEERDHVIYHMKARLAGEDVPPVYDTRIVRKDRSIAHVQLMNTVAKQKGKPIIMVTINDITERKRAEEALQKEKAFTEAALNALPDIFCVFDLEGRIIRWNKTLTEVTGYTDAELSSMKTLDFFAEDDFQYGKGAFSEIFKGGEGVIKATILAKKGKRIPYELTGSLLKDEEGNVLAISAIGRDISKRKKSKE